MRLASIQIMQTGMLEIVKEADDDSLFIEVLANLTAGAVTSHRPLEIYLIKVRDFFDGKWAVFLHKTLGHSASGGTLDR